MIKENQSILQIKMHSNVISEIYMHKNQIILFLIIENKLRLRKMSVYANKNAI